MNILLGVYACEPNNGSEPEVGWQMVNKIANLLPNDNIYAITKRNNKEVIEQEGYPSNVTFFYYEPPKWLTFWKKGGRGIRTYYYIWSYGAALFLKKKNISFDIIHHITFVNDWLPSFYYKLKSKNSRFIWGPIGSNDPISFKFLNTNKLKIQEIVTNSLKLFFRTFDPFFHICKFNADCIIGINKNVKNKLNLGENKYFLAEPAIAVENKFIEQCKKTKEKDSNFSIISVGRLVHIKNFKLSVLAFNKFLKNNPDIKNVKLILVGDGPDKNLLKEIAISNNIEANVQFVGKVPLNDVQNYLSNSNLFFFPTLENAGFVTIEAMANSLPVLAMKYGGPEQFVINNRDEQLVDESLSYDELVNEFAKKIKYFYQNKEISENIGKQNKQDIIENFTWEAKAQKMLNLYKELLNEKN
jgi:glycosyltransferase involved in cell wall biosynthesis